MNRKSILDRWDLLLTILGVLIALVLFFLDLLPNDFIFPLIITVLGVIAFNQLRENIAREEYLTHIEKLYGKSIDIQTIDQKEFYRRLKSLVSEAKTTVDLISIEPFTPETSGIEEKTEYFKVIKEVVKKKKGISYRFIYALPEEPILRSKKIDWLRGRLTWYKDCGNVNMRLVDLGKMKIAYPLISVQIIDEAFILIVDLRTGTHPASQRTEDLWCNSPLLVRHFANYFDTLWSSCTVLKEGTSIDWEVIDS